MLLSGTRSWQARLSSCFPEAQWEGMLDLSPGSLFINSEFVVKSSFLLEARVSVRMLQVMIAASPTADDVIVVMFKFPALIPRIGIGTCLRC